ncbi:MAG: hypothetical protein ACRD26_00095 [Vicinamibacterales bacterium]
MDIIAAEDTRRTARLLHHDSIATPTISFHEHNTRRRVAELLSRLRRGESVALVSDAGTPVLSNPSLDLIRECLDCGVPVDPVRSAKRPPDSPGRVGIPRRAGDVTGVRHNRSIDRVTWLAEIDGIPHTVVFFEAPHRIHASLTDAGMILGERQMQGGRTH